MRACVRVLTLACLLDKKNTRALICICPSTHTYLLPPLIFLSLDMDMIVQRRSVLWAFIVIVPWSRVTSGNMLMSYTHSGPPEALFPPA